jgi:hypothetical protein
MDPPLAIGIATGSRVSSRPYIGKGLPKAKCLFSFSSIITQMRTLLSIRKMKHRQPDHAQNLQKKPR